MKNYYGRTVKVGLAFFAAWALLFYFIDWAIADDIQPTVKVVESYDTRNFKDAGELLKFCGSQDSTLLNICYGYVEGVSDAVNYLLFKYGKERIYCLPDHIKSDVLGGMVMEYLIENPRYQIFMSNAPAGY